MPASFEEFTPLLNIYEGGYVNIPNDPGGETNGGISKMSYPHLDIKNLSFEARCAIYKQDFWDFYKIGQFNNQLIANKVMLAVINENPYSAIRCLQRAINHCGGSTIEDGVIGSKTIQWANSVAQSWLADRLSVEHCAYYSSRVDADKTKIVFLNGWIKRALV